MSKKMPARILLVLCWRNSRAVDKEKTLSDVYRLWTGCSNFLFCADDKERLVITAVSLVAWFIEYGDGIMAVVGVRTGCWGEAFFSRDWYGQYR
jgi:hypothetical protein